MKFLCHRISPIYALLVILLIFLFSYSLFGEKISYNDGAGFDGEFYRNVAQNFSSDILNNGYDSFRIQRIFPFFLLHIFYSIFSIPATHQNLLYGMGCLQCINLFSLIFFFFKLAKLLKWSENVTALLFACLFFNYYFLKNCGYELFQTDSFAINLSLISYYFLLRKQVAASYISALIGFFTWPTITTISCILILFNKPVLYDFQKASFPFKTILPLLYFAGFCFIYFALYLCKRQAIFSSILMFPAPFYYLIITASITALFLFFFLRKISLSFIPSYRDFFSCLKPKKFLLILASLSILKYACHILSNQEFYYSRTLFALQIYLRPLKYPLVFLVNHITYWGIFFILILYFFPDFSSAFMSKSPGHVIVLFIFLFFALDSESRHISAFVPLLLPSLANTLSHIRLSKKSLCALITLQLALSHFYYPINVSGIEKAFENGDFFTFPAQRYFMNFGPWMNTESYLFWLATSILAAFFTIAILKRASKKT